MSNFCHIHTHDQYSQLDGVGTAEQYAKAASELGHVAIGTTNHGNVDGVIKWQQACDKAGINPLIGSELYVVDDLSFQGKGEKRFHICVFAKNRAGFSNMMRLLTKANIEGYYRKPRVTMPMILDHIEGTLVTTACSSSFLNMKRGEEYLCMIQDAIGPDVFVEIMPHNWGPQKEFNKKAISIAKRNNIRLIASNDCHYPSRDKELVQEVLLAIQTRRKWSDPTRWKFEVTGLYLNSEKEMRECFMHQGVVEKRDIANAIRNTLLVNEKCGSFRVEKMPVELPLIRGYEGVDESNLLREISYAGLAKRIRPIKPKYKKIEDYKERMREELGLICELGFQLLDAV